MSNSTQNDWYDHAVKNPGFKSGLNALKNDTQNDMAKRFDRKCNRDTKINKKDPTILVGFPRKNSPIYKGVKDFIRKELADARREVIDSKIKKIEKMKVNLKSWESRPSLHSRFQLHNETMDDVLATLREEEGK